MGTNTKRERGDIVALGGLTDNELFEIRKKAGIAENQLTLLGPYFDELEQMIHKKWAELPLDDGPGAKTLKFELYAIRKLRQIMLSKITHGKQAAKKLEG